MKQTIGVPIKNCWGRAIQLCQNFMNFSELCLFVLYKNEKKFCLKFRIKTKKKFSLPINLSFLNFYPKKVIFKQNLHLKP